MYILTFIYYRYAEDCGYVFLAMFMIIVIIMLQVILSGESDSSYLLNVYNFMYRFIYLDSVTQLTLLVVYYSVLIGALIGIGWRILKKRDLIFNVG